MERSEIIKQAHALLDQLETALDSWFKQLHALDK